MDSGAPGKKPHYRPDIDGLRAVAVLAVVIFHINAGLMPGGFVGVDIFFVISGYLITGNILKGQASNRGFSWAEFYRRRALRILPVLFVVILATLVVGHFILLPDDLKELSYVSIASILPTANIYFTYFLDTGYFADASALQPLLHLWSLGVEEQFYLFWPTLLLLLLARAKPAAQLAIVALLAAASFVLAESLLASQPMFAYYMLPTRAGELLIGALLAMLLRQGPLAHLPTTGRNLAGLTGIALIVFSLFWITEDAGFPGVNALPSTVGAALIIWAGSGQPSLVSRVLALPLLVFIGLISYSLYLWHWPVLAFYRYAYGAVGPLAGIGLFGLMMILSVLSYRWVERPARRIKWSFPEVVFKGLAPSSIALFSLCGALLLSSGYGLYALDERYRHALSLIKPAPAAFTYPYVCQSSRLNDDSLNRATCIISNDPSQEPAALLWGDSHAAHYIGVLGAFAEEGHFSFRNAAHSSCPPIFDGIETVLPLSRQTNCRNSIVTVKKHLDRYSTVVMGGAWSGYLRRNPEFFTYLENTVDTLLSEGKHVVLLGQVPSFRNVDRKCQQKALKTLVRGCPGEETGELLSPVPTVNQSLQRLASQRRHVTYFDVSAALCQDNVCRSTVDGGLVYYDGDHLSMDGSWAVGRRLKQESDVPAIFLAATAPP